MMKPSVHHDLLRQLLLVFGCLSIVASCLSSRSHRSVVSSPRPVERMAGSDPSQSAIFAGSFWQGDHMTGSPSVHINLAEQQAYLFKGNQLAGVSRISSGREGIGTVTGSFSIIEKIRDHRSSLFGNYVDANGAVIQSDVDTSKDPMPQGASYEGAIMRKFMRIVDGTGMHEGFLPGYPASHGCIRMPGHMAEAFFNTVSVGTPVRIE